MPDAAQSGNASVGRNGATSLDQPSSSPRSPRDDRFSGLRRVFAASRTSSSSFRDRRDNREGAFSIRAAIAPHLGCPCGRARRKPCHLQSGRPMADSRSSRSTCRPRIGAISHVSPLSTIGLSFSPNGEEIAFRIEPRRAIFEIYVMAGRRIRGAKAHRSRFRPICAPAWSADGKAHRVSPVTATVTTRCT